MKRVFKITGWILSFILAVGFGLIASIWFFPSIVLNARALQFAKDLLQKEGIILEWENASLSGESLSFFEKAVHLNIDGLCVKIEAEGISGCFKTFQLSAQGGYIDGKLGVHQVGPVEILGEWARYAPKAQGPLLVAAPSPTAKSEKEANSEFSLPSWLVTAYPKKVHLLLPKVEMISGAFSPKGRVELRADGQKDWTGELNASASYQKQMLNLQSKAKGKPSQAELQITAEGKGFTDVVPFVKAKGCVIKWDKGAKNEELDFNCPIRATLAMKSVADIPISKLTKNVSAEVGAHFTKPNAKDTVQGKIKLDAATVFSAIRDGKAAIEVETDGNVYDLKKWKYKHNSSLTVQEFKRLRDFLEDTTWAIPQPFHALDGQVSLTAQGEGTFSDFEGPLPLKLTTELRSISQVLKIEVQTLLSKNNLKVDAVFKEVKLALPSLDVTSVPPIFPDSRIHRTDPRTVVSAHPSPSEPFTYEISFRTENAKRIELISHLGKAPVPLTLNLSTNEEAPVHGRIQVKSFDLDLFKRNAKVDFINLKLAKDPEMSTIDGQVRVFYTDYTITIMLDGLLDSPTVHLASDPPLPEKQVIAVLLFGRSLDFLEADQMESVGNTRAALADGAIGLASLYALASTPIESIGYNSISQTFTAKLRLSDGTSINIGSDLKRVNTLGLRRRLSPNWSINTYLENPFLAAERSLSSFLEWHLRY